LAEAFNALNYRNGLIPNGIRCLLLDRLQQSQIRVRCN